MNDQPQSNRVKISDAFTTDEEFENLLEDARAGCHTDRDVGFVDDMATRFETWGGNMFITPRQREWLENLAGN